MLNPRVRVRASCPICTQADPTCPTCQGMGLIERWITMEELYQAMMTAVNANIERSLIL